MLVRLYFVGKAGLIHDIPLQLGKRSCRTLSLEFVIVGMPSTCIPSLGRKRPDAAVTVKWVRCPELYLLQRTQQSITDVPLLRNKSEGRTPLCHPNDLTPVSRFILAGEPD